jgi:hypothetical protein
MLSSTEYRVVGSALADCNRDGSLDVVALNDASSAPTQLTVAFGNGGGAFGKPIVSAAASSRLEFHAALADLNGDRLPDVAYLNDDGSAIVVYVANSE